MAFEPGSVVWLNSGGPALTIQEVIGDKVLVTWFTGGFGDKGRCNDVFPRICLTDYDPTKTPSPTSGRTPLSLVARSDRAEGSRT